MIPTFRLRPDLVCPATPISRRFPSTDQDPRLLQRNRNQPIPIRLLRHRLRGRPHLPLRPVHRHPSSSGRLCVVVVEKSAQRYGLRRVRVREGVGWGVASEGHQSGWRSYHRKSSLPCLSILIAKLRHLTRPLLSSLQVLPILESLHSVYGPISVIHFDAHIDTWNPKRYMGSLSPQADINHGTFFWHAYEKGFIKPGSNIHAGIRTRFSVSLRVWTERSSIHRR